MGIPLIKFTFYLHGGSSLPRGPLGLYAVPSLSTKPPAGVADRRGTLHERVFALQGSCVPSWIPLATGQPRGSRPHFCQDLRSWLASAFVLSPGDTIRHAAWQRQVK